jgi:hypothetical protein
MTIRRQITKFFPTELSSRARLPVYTFLMISLSRIILTAELRRNHGAELSDKYNQCGADMEIIFSQMKNFIILEEIIKPIQSQAMSQFKNHDSRATKNFEPQAPGFMDDQNFIMENLDKIQRNLEIEAFAANLDLLAKFNIYHKNLPGNFTGSL